MPFTDSDVRDFIGRTAHKASAHATDEDSASLIMADAFAPWWNENVGIDPWGGAAGFHVPSIAEEDGLARALVILRAAKNAGVQISPPGPPVAKKRASPFHDILKAAWLTLYAWAEEAAVDAYREFAAELEEAD